MMIVRHAVKGDAASLVELNRRWQRDNVPSLSRGFLSAGLSAEVCEGVIERGEAVAAFEGGRAVGYYMLNPAPKFHVLHEMVTRRRIQRRELASGVRVGHSAQGVIETDYRGRGLLARMVDAFCRLIEGRYDVVVGTVDLQNPCSLRAHSKVGFRIVDSVGGFHVLSRPVTKIEAAAAARPSGRRTATSFGLRLVPLG